MATAHEHNNVQVSHTMELLGFRLSL